MLERLKRIYKRLRDAEKSGTLYPTFDANQARRQGIIAREVTAELQELGDEIATFAGGPEKLLFCCVQGWLYLMIAPKSKTVFDRWETRVGKAIRDIEKGPES